MLLNHNTVFFKVEIDFKTMHRTNEPKISRHVLLCVQNLKNGIIKCKSFLLFETVSVNISS